MAQERMFRTSTVYLATLLGIVVGLIVPFFPLHIVGPFIALFLYSRLKEAGRIKRFDWLELLLIVIYTLGLLVVSIGLGVVAYNSIPWWKIILVGMAADVFGNVLGAIPIWGDVISAFLVLVLAFTVIGGAAGAAIALCLAIINMVPGPSLAANTMFLISFKIISELVAYGVGF